MKKRSSCPARLLAKEASEAVTPKRMAASASPEANVRDGRQRQAIQSAIVLVIT
jgi:hypothetical protein